MKHFPDPVTTIEYSLLGVLMLWVLIEDFKYRAVRWWIFPLMGIVAVGIEYPRFRIEDVYVNSGFTLVQLAMLSLYFSLKEKKVVNITRKYLGWGDILLWVVLCLLFSPLNFVLFFMASMIFVSLVVAGWKLSKIKPEMNTVPLAGIQSLALVVTMITTLFLENISFRNDAWIEKWMTA